VLIQVGQARTIAVDLRLAIWLSLVAGAVNAAGFRALGYFSANMTGNVSTASDMLALGRFAGAFWLLMLLAAFVFGAFVSGLLIAAGERRNLRGIYAFSILLEAGLLVGLALLDLTWSAQAGGQLMMVGLSMLMGLQNAATTKISDAKVRTSHVSGIATDLGLELAELSRGRAALDPARRDVLLARLVLHLATLFAFFGGGISGVWGYEQIGPMVFVIIAALLMLIALPELRKAYRSGENGRG
jgi:Predicted membrane protein